MHKILVAVFVLCSACAHNNTGVTVKAIKIKHSDMTVFVKTSKVQQDDSDKAVVELSVEAIEQAGALPGERIIVDDTDRRREFTTDVVKDTLSSAGYKVSGYSEVGVVLENERMKDLLGCNDVQCLTEIGMALDTDYIITHNIYSKHIQKVETTKVVTKDYYWQGTLGGILLAGAGITGAIWLSDYQSSNQPPDAPDTQRTAYDIYISPKNETNHKAYGIAVGTMVTTSLILIIWELLDD